MNTALKTTNTFHPSPVLRSIFRQAELQHRKIQQMFTLLGWEDLPEGLKYIIEDDVKGYVDELEGRYSTNCPLVQRRRESVDFWISSFQDGICTLNTAVESLKVTKL